MIWLVVRRLGFMAATMLAVSVALFLLFELDVADLPAKVLGRFSSPEQRLLWLEANGYLAPLHERYFDWLGRFVQGDFGQSIRFRAPVAEVLWPRLANTAILGLVTLAIVAMLGVALGVLAGMKADGVRDRAISLAAIITTSIPEFASAVFLSAVFVFALGWLPGTSAMSAGFAPGELILPVAVLVLYDVGYVARMTRVSMIEVMAAPFVRTAMLKGISRTRVVLRHALPNALIAPFTVIMLQVNWLLSGVIVVEVFFGYKGFGALLLEAAVNQDVFVIEACAMIALVVAVATQTLADLGYALLDPRVRVT